MKTNYAMRFLRAAVLLAAFWGGSNLTQAQTFTTLYSFAGYTVGDGEYPFPRGQMPFDKNGALYGTTAGGGSTQWGTVFQLVPPQTQGGAWTENVLYTFAGGADGRQPSEGVVFDALGNLYGSTQFGGTGTVCGGECGTIFELSPPTQPGGQWTHTVLYSFQGDVDGQYPGEVLFGANGVLYGTTQSGGPNPGVPCHSNRRITFGCGTVFELSPPARHGGSWTKTVLYTFPGFAGDGVTPSTEIAIDSQSNIYGTADGGTKSYGMVYKLTPPNGSGAWKETALYDFTGSTKDGGYPSGGVLLGANGVLYGTGTFNGVTNPNGIYTPSGVVYQLTPPQQPGGAWTETVLHSFPAFKADGTNPNSTLSIDQNGNLYGTTEFGGSTACYEGCGTIFKLATPSGGGEFTETILYELGNSGQTPNSSIVEFHNGLLYGTTTYLGASDLGQVFTLVP